jgi:hypothetical protein
MHLLDFGLTEGVQDVVGAACSVVAGGVHAGVVDVLGGGTHVDFGSSLVVVGAGAGAYEQDAQLDSAAEKKHYLHRCHRCTTK